jgi:acyl carrier protein
MQVSIDQFIQELEPELEGLPAGALKPNTSYREVEGWSSMHALILIAFVDSRFGITLTGEDLRSCVTVNDLYSVISARVEKV